MAPYSKSVVDEFFEEKPLLLEKLHPNAQPCEVILGCCEEALWAYIYIHTLDNVSPT